jgi:2-polyprenyl-6-methoxyphenol hydroxylase-like FAD-dependent oxidoreductase
MQKLTTQVMIAGCGPVGLALAVCLLRSPFVDSLVLLDRKVPSESRELPPVGHQRVYSMTGASLKLLSNLQILPQIRRKGIMVNVQVVSKESLAFVNWHHNEANVIENDELLYALMK